MDWSVDTKCKSRDDDCKCWDFDVSLRESGGVGHQHLELLLFKRRPRFTSLKIFSRLPRVPFSKKNFWTIQVDLIKPTDDSEIFFGIFISLLAGALCDNSRQYFFTWAGSFVKKIASSGKKTEASNPETTHPPQKFFGIRRRLGTQSELIGSLDRIEPLFKKISTRFDLSVAMRSLSVKFEIIKLFFKKIKFRNRTRAVERVEPSRVPNDRPQACLDPNP
jgi:hypothetical protein